MKTYKVIWFAGKQFGKWYHRVGTRKIYFFLGSHCLFLYAFIATVCFSFDFDFATDIVSRGSNIRSIDTRNNCKYMKPSIKIKTKKFCKVSPWLPNSNRFFMCRVAIQQCFINRNIKHARTLYFLLLGFIPAQFSKTVVSSEQH